MITSYQLSMIARAASEPRVRPFVQPLNDAMQEFRIDTPMLQAAFLAHVCYESGSFYILHELTTGEEYEGRLDLGNTEPGDGAGFRGRGLLQIRGRKNYELCGNALELDLIENPGLLEEHPHSSRSAAWYWSECMNSNQLVDLLLVAKRINGGFDGWAERSMYFDYAKRELGLKR